MSEKSLLESPRTIGADEIMGNGSQRTALWVSCYPSDIKLLPDIPVYQKTSSLNNPVYPGPKASLRDKSCLLNL